MQIFNRCVIKAESKDLILLPRDLWDRATLAILLEPHLIYTSVRKRTKPSPYLTSENKHWIQTLSAGKGGSCLIFVPSLWAAAVTSATS